MDGQTGSLSPNWASRWDSLFPDEFQGSPEGQEQTGQFQEDMDSSPLEMTSRLADPYGSVLGLDKSWLDQLAESDETTVEQPSVGQAVQDQPRNISEAPAGVAANISSVDLGVLSSPVMGEQEQEQVAKWNPLSAQQLTLSGPVPQTGHLPAAADTSAVFNFSDPLSLPAAADPSAVPHLSDLPSLPAAAESTVAFRIDEGPLPTPPSSGKKAQKDKSILHQTGAGVKKSKAAKLAKTTPGGARKDSGRPRKQEVDGPSQKVEQVGGLTFVLDTRAASNLPNVHQQAVRVDGKRRNTRFNGIFDKEGNLVTKKAEY
ncbi:hypothetical protein UCRPC4_g02186 [Phaeomoniella chlamydospora]|uniref:Uncharacterized protein n=1 Tax=Phaeomoniella chlamydospora TaxID=158046 RepID=A0A0G2H8N1_PHACM|nr:hypothetical protein UCRPC4_g02186 [Phaeomoniella chlamydospora]